MKRLLLLVLSITILFSFTACNKAKEKVPIESQTEIETIKEETAIPIEEITEKNKYIKSNGEKLRIVIEPEDVEEIRISDLRSAPDVCPTQKIIKDKDIKEKIIYLIGSIDFKISKDKKTLKPGTTMVIHIDDKVTLSFQGKLYIDGIYCEYPVNFYNHLLGLYNSAPEKTGPIKF